MRHPIGIGMRPAPRCRRRDVRIKIQLYHMRGDVEHRRDPTIVRFVFLFAIQILPPVLLVLYGWGFNDLRTLLSNPARAGFVVATLAAVASAALLRLDIYPLRRGRTVVGGQGLQLGVLLLLSLGLLWFLPFADRREILTVSHEYWRYFGLTLYVIGVSVRIAALYSLGEYFSAYVTLQSNHRLIQNGIYGSVRHPLYLSLLLAPTGIALVFASLLAFPILILASIFVLDRIRKEERLLGNYFGSEFVDYQGRTRKLIPLIF